MLIIHYYLNYKAIKKRRNYFQLFIEIPVSIGLGLPINYLSTFYANNALALIKRDFQSKAAF